MSGLLCPRCGASNSLRAVLSGMLAFNVNVVPLRCRSCGETSSILRSFGGYVGLLLAFAVAMLALWISAVEILQPRNLLPFTVASAVIPAAVLPLLWAHLFLRSDPVAGVAPPGDLPATKKVGYLAGALTMALLVVAVGIVVHTISRIYSRPPPEVGATASTDLDAEALAWSCRTISGEELVLADLRDEVVFLNVWATWCGPCIAEMPSIAALAQAVRDRGVRFVLVSEENPEQVRAFAEERELDLPFATSRRLPEALRTQGIPATFVLHRGAIVYQHIGAADWNDAGFRDWLSALR